MVVLHNSHSLHLWELILDVRKLGSHCREIIGSVYGLLYAWLYRSVISVHFHSLQQRGLLAAAIRMSSSVEWTGGAFPCVGAAMETRTAWTSATRRTAKVSLICATLPSSSPARTRVSTTHIYFYILFLQLILTSESIKFAEPRLVT